MGVDVSFRMMGASKRWRLRPAPRRSRIDERDLAERSRVVSARIEHQAQAAKRQARLEAVRRAVERSAERIGGVGEG